MISNGLGLNTANRSQGLGVMPAGTLLELVMEIRAGNVGLDGMLKRTSKGDAEFLDVIFTVKGGEYDRRKIFHNMLLDGTTSGHATAAEISRSLLRAIFEAVHGIDPGDNSPAANALREGATLAAFHGATFLATVEIERGGKRPDGGNYKDKNAVGKVLRPGDQGYRRLDQPPAMPIERSTPPVQPHGGAVPPGGAPAMAGNAIAKPSWAQ